MTAGNSDFLKFPLGDPLGDLMEQARDEPSQDVKKAIEGIQGLSESALAQVETRAGLLVEHDIAGIVHSLNRLRPRDQRAFLYLLIVDVKAVFTRYQHVAEHLAKS